MRARLVTAALLLVGSPAAAQTTNCWTIGQQITCRTDPPLPAPPQAQPFNPMASVQQGYSFAEQMRQKRAAQQQAQERDQAQQRADALRTELADEVIRGDCQAAVRTAIMLGDAAMVRAISDGCKPSQGK